MTVDIPPKSILYNTTSLTEPAAVLHRDYPYLNNVNIDPRLSGFQAGLIPFLPGTSSPRVDMYASHLNQAMVLDGGEFPMIFAGPEQNLGEYEFSKTRRNQDITVLEVIPKYPTVFGPNRIGKNPSLTVIYVGHTDKKLHYMTIDSYHKGSDGFGYELVWENTHLLTQPNTPITKETRLTTSPNHRDGLYGMGLNLNVAYMTLEETIEDAMLLSESAAEKMMTSELHEVKIIVRPDQYPLNVYGHEDEVRFMPDIGDIVNADGILAIFRPLNAETIISDTTKGSLDELQQLHDDVYVAPAGSVILDITINAAHSSKAPKSLYAQADKYVQASNKYWQEIVRVYGQNRQTYELAEESNTLLSTAIQRLTAAGIAVQLPGVSRKPKTKLIGKNKQPIEFMEITIVFATKRKFAPGFKITGRDGAKGVCCRILPDKYMPIDDYGFRADLVVDPSSCISRMTMGPLYEPAINRTSEFVRRRLAELFPSDPRAAGAMLLDYLADINPNYSAHIREVMSTDQDMAEFVKYCIDTRINMHIPPGLNTIGLELIQKLKNKWKIPLSPVTFTQCDMDNNVIAQFRTRANVCIGSKYTYLLCKIPEPSSPGVARINQYNTPMKSPPSDKFMYPIKQSPIRTGEDELRIIVMDLEHPQEHERLMCLQGSSPKGINAVAEALLNEPYPTRIKRIPLSNTQLMTSNTVIQVFDHMLSTMGVGITTAGPVPILGDLLRDVKK